MSGDSNMSGMIRWGVIWWSVSFGVVATGLGVLPPPPLLFRLPLNHCCLRSSACRKTMTHRASRPAGPGANTRPFFFRAVFPFVPQLIAICFPEGRGVFFFFQSRT